MKRSVKNLMRIYACIVIISMMLCASVYAGDLESVYKQVLPSWWYTSQYQSGFVEGNFIYQNRNPNMEDNTDWTHYPNNPDGQVDYWSFDGSEGSTCEYIPTEEVQIQISGQANSYGQLSDNVNNQANVSMYKEFAFHLRFKSVNSFCSLTGTALANLTVRVYFKSSNPAENTVDGFEGFKDYPILIEGLINPLMNMNDTYYDVTICDRLDWQPASEKICLVYSSDGMYPWYQSPHSLIVSKFDFRTKCHWTTQSQYPYGTGPVWSCENGTCVYNPVTKKCTVVGDLFCANPVDPLNGSMIYLDFGIEGFGPETILFGDGTLTVQKGTKIVYQAGIGGGWLNDQAASTYGYNVFLQVIDHTQVDRQFDSTCLSWSVESIETTRSWQYGGLYVKKLGENIRFVSFPTANLPPASYNEALMNLHLAEIEDVFGDLGGALLNSQLVEIDDVVGLIGLEDSVGPRIIDPANCVKDVPVDPNITVISQDENDSGLYTLYYSLDINDIFTRTAPFIETPIPSNPTETPTTFVVDVNLLPNSTYYAAVDTSTASGEVSSFTTCDVNSALSSRCYSSDCNAVLLTDQYCMLDIALQGWISLDFDKDCSCINSINIIDCNLAGIIPGPFLLDTDCNGAPEDFNDCKIGLYLPDNQAACGFADCNTGYFSLSEVPVILTLQDASNPPIYIDASLDLSGQISLEDGSLKGTACVKIGMCNETIFFRIYGREIPTVPPIAD